MFDIGVNLTSSQLAEDRTAVLERARSAGLRGLAITGTSTAESRQALDLCESLRGVFGGDLCATVGIHPHHADEWHQGSREELLALLRHPAAVAVGETGLDFNRNFSPPERQIESFEHQLDIAAETGKPIFLHERDAFDRQIAMLRSYRHQLSDAVAHCFTGDREQLHSYLDLGFYIGITGWVCDERRGAELADIVGDIPMDRLLIETDAPWLLPRNIRPRPKSRRNEPAYLAWIVRFLAERLNTTEAAIAEHTEANTRRFFRLEQP